MESVKFGHCVSGTSPAKTGADIPRHGLDLVHVTAHSQIPHGNFVFRLGGGLGTIAFGIGWDCRLDPGFSSMSPQESSARKCVVSALRLELLG